MKGRLAAAIISGACVACAAYATPPSFRGLGVRPQGQSGGPYQCVCVSADGRVVGVTASFFDEGLADVVDQANLWAEAGGYQLLPGMTYPAGLATRLTGLSADGAAAPVVRQWAHTADPASTIRWNNTPPGTTTLPSGYLGHGISGDGVYLGLSYPASRWSSAGGLEALPAAGNGLAPSEALGFSFDGQAIAGVGLRQTGPNAYEQLAFLWRNGQGTISLGTLPGASLQRSGANAISADGRTVVGYSADATSAGVPMFWREAGGMKAPHMPGGATWGQLLAVSADGEVMVGSVQRPPSTALTLAFRWDRVAGSRDMKTYLLSLGLTQVSGWILSDAVGISADGTVIVGNGFNTSGYPEPWIAHVPAFCYANCDVSVAAPVLNVADFACFINRFASADPYANCDQSTAAPVLNISDFTCFLNRFAAGCPQ